MVNNVLHVTWLTPVSRALPHPPDTDLTFPEPTRVIIPGNFTMAAVFKAINAKIRSNSVLDYVCSTHFWGPVSNFGIPIAAVMDTQKDAEIISGPMTGALVVYAATFMRYSLAITPKNYLLFACHLTNFGAQTTQAFRYMNYWKWGGREKQLAEKAAAKGGAAAEAGA
ncbi:hypothetical protein PENVUL_c002G03554 [Penicillium vulpinum]|uniref:Mitochondrial pyruvate carrier n=2 Tax=Penicillium vulpinum TaxID=29845 RepID=A0A1V6SCV1_9EURO|nr:hypothetical protein PENVUL_c002G03554 [Penicillium vulpinum]